MYGDQKEIDAQVTILSTYNDEIRIEILDKTSCMRFVELKLTREQFINAVMNRLGNTDVKQAFVCGLDRVGKKVEMEIFEFEIGDHGYNIGGRMTEAREIAMKTCPFGYVPDLSFPSRGSFFVKGDKHYARTTIRRWV